MAVSDCIKIIEQQITLTTNTLHVYTLYVIILCIAVRQFILFRFNFCCCFSFKYINSSLCHVNLSFSMHQIEQRVVTTPNYMYHNLKHKPFDSFIYSFEMCLNVCLFVYFVINLKINNFQINVNIDR